MNYLDKKSRFRKHSSLRSLTFCFLMLLFYTVIFNKFCCLHFDVVIDTIVWSLTTCDWQVLRSGARTCFLGSWMTHCKDSLKPPSSTTLCWLRSLSFRRRTLATSDTFIYRFEVLEFFLSDDKHYSDDVKFNPIITLNVKMERRGQSMIWYSKFTIFLKLTCCFVYFVERA